MFETRNGISFCRLEDHPSYAVTSLGDVININKVKKLNPVKDDRGYLKVRLDGKKYLVSRLIAEAFVPNPDSKPNVTYLDGDKSNVAASNLKWADNSEIQL